MQADDNLKVRRVQLIIDQIDTLPTLPAVAARVLSLATSDTSSASDLTSIIESDQSLASRILALVNSAAFRRGQPVGSIDRAVTMLGFEAVRNSVLSLKAFDLFSRKEAGRSHSAFDRRAFWKHSLAVAGAAQLIARRVRGVSPEEAFVAGLVHDIGKVALDHALPKTFDQVVRRVDAQRISFSEAEVSILGLEHAAVGRRLAENWHFPEQLTNVIWLHHQNPDQLPQSIAGRSMVKIVHLADLVARAQRIGLSSPAVDLQMMADAASELKLPEGFIKDTSKDLHRIVAEHVQALGLEMIDEQQLFCESLQSANSELGQINQQLMVARRRLENQKRHAQVLAALGQESFQAGTSQELLGQIAQAFKAWLETEVCAVYCCHGGAIEGLLLTPGRRSAESFLIESGDSAGDSSGGTGLTRAERSASWLFDRFGEQMGEGEFYRCPLWANDTLLGGAVFAWPADRSGPTQTDARDLQSLEAMAGLALGRWIEQRRLADVSDQLAEANRRTVEMQDELLRRRNMASVAVMAAGAAHEINNPLAVISGRAQLLAEIEEDAKKLKSLQIITDQADRASGIANELMSFARPPAPRQSDVDLGKLTHKARKRAAAKASEQQITLTTEIAEGVPTVRVDREQMAWVLDELLTNALAATPADGTITVAVESDPEGGTVVLRVTDSGAGMDAETLANACEPFFCGREAGRRRGLGLAKVERIADLNSASLTLDSAVDQGTTVRLVFSLVEDDASPGMG
jgi:putative nucleotidyltransferase with HDIG domain